MISSAAPADGNHGVDRLDTGLEGFTHGLARNNTRRDAFQRIALIGLHGTFAVERLPQGVHDTANESVAYRHRHNLAGSALR